MAAPVRDDHWVVVCDGDNVPVFIGYTDVMAMHLAGVKTAVAACGTAFGGEHLSVLRRLLLHEDLQ
jgi:DNA primase